MKQKALKELSKMFGVNVKIDKTLDKNSKTDLFPEKTKKAIEMLSKTRLKFN